jgi:malate synthase
MLYLYKNNFINGIPYNQAVKELSAKNDKLQKKIDKFWDSFDVSIKMNNRGLDGKQKILSIIADNFLYRELQDNLKVIFITIYNSCLHSN